MSDTDDTRAMRKRLREWVGGECISEDGSVDITIEGLVKLVQSEVRRPATKGAQKRERAAYGDTVTARIGELEAALERVKAERDEAKRYGAEYIEKTDPFFARSEEVEEKLARRTALLQEFIPSVVDLVTRVSIELATDQQTGDGT